MVNIGDIVRIISATELCIPRSLVGKTGEVVGKPPHNGSGYAYSVRVDGGTWRVSPKDFVLAGSNFSRELRVGDKVRIKSREWYEANKNRDGLVPVPCGFIPDMVKYCGKTFEIESITLGGNYDLKGADYSFSKEMFEDEPIPFKAKDFLTSLFKRDDKPTVTVDLITSKKLLTTIKLD